MTIRASLPNLAALAGQSKPELVSLADSFGQGIVLTLPEHGCTVELYAQAARADSVGQAVKLTFLECG
jgi:hypothetical protein